MIGQELVRTTGFEPVCFEGSGFKDRCVYQFHHVRGRPRQKRGRFAYGSFNGRLQASQSLNPPAMTISRRPMTEEALESTID